MSRRTINWNDTDLDDLTLVFSTEGVAGFNITNESHEDELVWESDDEIQFRCYREDITDSIFFVFSGFRPAFCIPSDLAENFTIHITWVMPSGKYYPESTPLGIFVRECINYNEEFVS